MASTRAVTVTDTATVLNSGVRSRGFYAHNDDGSVTMYVGGEDVTASGATKGVPVPAGQGWEDLGRDPGEDIYAIVASGSITVLVYESGSV